MMSRAPLTPRLPPQWPYPSLPTPSPLIKELGEKQGVEATAGMQNFPGYCVYTSLTTATQERELGGEGHP